MRRSITIRVSRFALMLVALVAASLSTPRADTTAQSIPFAQNWTNIGLITVDDNWNGVPGIIGYRGDGLVSSTGVNPQTVLADGTTTPVDVNANQTNPNTFATGGVAEFHIANPAVALNGSGTARAPFVLITINTTGLSGIKISYNLRDLDASADNASSQVALHYRVGTTGTFTNLPAGYVADASTQNAATLVTPVSVTLPSAADNQPVVQLRIMTTDAAGNDEWIGIDDISITTTATPPTGIGSATPPSVSSGDSSRLTVAVTPGQNPVSSGLSVVADLTAIGGSSTQPLLDDGTQGDEVANDLVFSFMTTVTGTPGSTSIPFVVSDAQSRSTSGTFTVDILSPPVPIHDLQGSGGSSPWLGVTVTTPGIVTAKKPNGFFLQAADDDVDADASTSEGIFVFTSTAPPVSIGDAVTVTGKVSEFFQLTEIDTTLPSGVMVRSTGNALPTAVTLTTSILTSNAPPDLERYESMRLHADAVVSVGPTNSFGEILTVLQGVPRPMREPGIEISNPVPPDPLTATVDCCIPRWDENPERLMIDTDGLAGAAALIVTSNVTLSNLTGPLDFTFGDYKLLPEAAPVASPNMSAVPVPVPAANEFTIAGYNIENYAGGPTQRKKAALAIRTVMRLPDVIGHVEIQSLAALQALAAEVNADTLAATGADPRYEAFLIPFGNGTQHVGFLVKTSRVLVHSVTQERTTDTFINPVNGQAETLHDRPPLVLRATVDSLGANPGDIIVVVNHTRSFIDIEDAGEGARVRAKRTAQAEAIASLLQELQTQNPNVPVISVGDYNAFEFNDGYTDPLSVIKGTPTPTEQVVVQASPDLVDPNFTNLTDSLPPAERYSFVFEGTPQALDHVIINSVAGRYLQRYAVARNNADFPEHASWSGNVARPERNSDHDMPVAYFAFPGTPVVTLNGSATMTVEAFTAFIDPGATAHDDFGPLPVVTAGTVNVNVPGQYELTYTASNGYKTTTVSRIVQVVDTTPPAIQGLSVSPATLGPPNHRMVEIAVSYDASDPSGIPACSIAVASNEAADGLGDGHTATDWRVLGDHAVALRAERSGTGTLRIYSLTVSCTDASGNVSSAGASVIVPR